MTSTRLSIRVDLVAGHGEWYWPRPGRLFAAAPTHSFTQLAEAIDDAFARWDRTHLHQFTRAHGSELGMLSHEGEVAERVLDYRRVKLSGLRADEQFAYVFDFGDQWQHVCTVGPKRIDPVETLGTRPARPLPDFGWGNIPDQYRRLWAGATVRVRNHDVRAGPTYARCSGTGAGTSYGRPEQRRVIVTRNRDLGAGRHSSGPSTADRTVVFSTPRAYALLARNVMRTLATV